MTGLSRSASTSDGMLFLFLSTSLDLDAAAARAAEMVREKGTLTSAGLASETGVPLTVAAEQLLEAERKALIARDDTVEMGLVFYPNLFLSAKG